MIVLDTTVLAYAVGTDHPLRAPARGVIAAVERHLDARTTIEVIQELTRVRSRRRSRQDAVDLARRYALALAPLLSPTASDLDDGLALFQDHPALGPFDAVLAATAVAQEAEALVSADPAFGGIPGLAFVHLASDDLADLLG